MEWQFRFPIPLSTDGKVTETVRVFADGRVLPMRFDQNTMVGFSRSCETAARQLARMANDACIGTPAVALTESKIRFQLTMAVEAGLRQFEASSPVVVSVRGQDGAWTGYASYQATGRDVPRLAHEGGTHYLRADAHSEAIERATRRKAEVIED